MDKNVLIRVSGLFKQQVQYGTGRMLHVTSLSHINAPRVRQRRLASAHRRSQSARCLLID